MCCWQHQSVIDECNDLFDENGEAIFYKVVIVRNNTLESAVIYYRWRVGINEAKMYVSEYRINSPQGFHVYVTKQDAETYLEVIKRVEEYASCCIIEVVCKKEHMITAGYSAWLYHKSSKESVFSQVTLTQQEWDEIIESK
ncbi:MAG: hypothetical protein QQN41_07305 [Nitrosopumilus sp.]